MGINFQKSDQGINFINLYMDEFFISHDDIQGIYQDWDKFDFSKIDFGSSYGYEFDKDNQYISLYDDEGYDIYLSRDQFHDQFIR